MGKKRLDRLLHQLKDQQQQDLQNTASIFTVAQVAVNELERQAEDPRNPTGEDGAAGLPALPGLASIDRATLLQKYGSYNGCRSAAKTEGITFRKTPTWNQLVAGFRYAETIRQITHHYLAAHPHPDLDGVSVMVDLS